MKKLLVLLLFLLSASALAENYTAAWDPVTQDVGGNAITIDGYNLYLGEVAGTRGLKIGTVAGTVNPPILVFTENRVGTHYLVVTAYKGTLESASSNEISITIATKSPKPPPNFRVTLK